LPIAAGLSQLRRVNADQTDFFAAGPQRVTVDDVNIQSQPGRAASRQKAAAPIAAAMNSTPKNIEGPRVEAKSRGRTACAGDPNAIDGWCP
jgi:hypothetical protein